MKGRTALMLILASSGLCFGQATGFPPEVIPGRGVPANMSPQQLTLLADQGIIPAQSNLGAMYANGKGVPKDCVQAYKWLTLAIAGAVETRGLSQGPLAMVDLRKSVAAQMTPQQIEEAERLAQEWETAYEQKMVNGPFKAGWGILMPKTVYGPMPSYTEAARRARVNGIVVVEFVVRKDGTVGNCKILRGLGHGLDESAVKTISQNWRFQPGTFKGRPVDIIAMAEVSFKIY